MRFGLPILLDLSARTVVIIGGGAVAVRKARGLLSAGARHVRVVAPRFREDMPAGVERVAQEYHPAHLDGAQIAFAATDLAELNTRIVRDARQRGLLVSRADEDQEHDDGGDFISPAVHRDGPLTIAVSAGSPTLSAAIRDGIAVLLDPRWIRMSEAMRVLRPRIRDDATASPDRRRALFAELTSEAALDVAADGPEALWDWLVRRDPDRGAEK